MILTLNDAAVELQPGIIEAAYEAGVKRVLPNEWAARLVVEGGGLDGMKTVKEVVVDRRCLYPWDLYSWMLKGLVMDEC